MTIPNSHLYLSLNRPIMITIVNLANVSYPTTDVLELLSQAILVKLQSNLDMYSDFVLLSLAFVGAVLGLLYRFKVRGGSIKGDQMGKLFFKLIVFHICQSRWCNQI